MSECCTWISEIARKFTLFQPCKGNHAFKAFLQCASERGRAVYNGIGLWKLAHMAPSGHVCSVLSVTLLTISEATMALVLHCSLRGTAPI